ncbi:MAG TPA: hypothetical protein VE842_20635 [Pyrinomonadaceae bacterium]|jgi:hypothetical protein|nr:hypothetical protein [Pyrinomonadaceae bacterium]
MSRALFQATTVIFLVCLWASPLPAQETGVRPPEPAQQQQQEAASDSARRTSADETFELNITERRITERDFAAMTSVEAGEESARGLRLRVGVEVGANEIDVLLRNVQGRVRFRATLARVLERLNSRQAPVTAP